MAMQVPINQSTWVPVKCPNSLIVGLGIGIVFKLEYFNSALLETDNITGYLCCQSNITNRHTKVRSL